MNFNTHPSSREFRVDLFENKIKKFAFFTYKSTKKRTFDITVEHNTLDLLARKASSNHPKNQEAKDNPTEFLENHRTELEYDVIRSVAEQAFEAQKNSRSSLFHLNIATTGNHDALVNITGKGVVGQTGFTNINILHRDPDKDTAKPWDKVRVEETTRHKGMLERFVAKEEKFTGRFAKLKKRLDPLFSSLGKRFKSIDNWWKKIIGERQPMAWNMSLLSEVCKVPPKEGQYEATLHEALTYIHRITKTNDTGVAERVKQAAVFDENLEKWRAKIEKFKIKTEKSKSKKTEENKKKVDKLRLKAADSISRNILKQIKNLKEVNFTNDFILVPFYSDKRPYILKINKNSNGYFSAFVDNPPCKLFRQQQPEWQPGEIATRLVFSELNQNELSNLIDRLIKASLFDESLPEEAYGNLPNFTIEQIEQKRSLTTTVMGLAQGILPHLAKSDSMIDYTLMAMRMRFFIDMCHESQNWLSDATYHEAVRKNCFIMMQECNQILKNKGLYLNHLQTELISIEKNIEAILSLTEKIQPEIQPISNYYLNEVGAQNYPEIKEVEPPLQNLKPAPLLPDDCVANMIKGNSTADIVIEKIKNIKNKNPLEQFLEQTQQTALRVEMSKLLTYAPTGSYTPTRSEGNLTDAEIVKNNFQMTMFPLIYNEHSLSKNEKLAIFYTLHSQKLQNNMVEANFTKPVLQQENNLARAHLTMQVFIDHPTIGRNDKAQAWLLAQLFDEKRLDNFMKDDLQRTDLNTYLKNMQETAEELLTTRKSDSSYEANLKGGLFLLRCVELIGLYIEKNHPAHLNECKKDIKPFSGFIDQKASTILTSSDSGDELTQRLLYAESLGNFYDKIACLKPPKDALDDKNLGFCLALYTVLPRIEKNKVNHLLLNKINELEPLIYAMVAERIKNNNTKAVDFFLTLMQSDVANQRLAWKISSQGFPILEAQTATQLLQLDLLTCETYTEGERATRLPSSLLNNPAVQKLMPNAATLYFKVQMDQAENNKFAFLHPKDAKLRIIATKNDKNYTCYVERNFGDADSEEWAVYRRFARQDLVLAGISEASADDEDISLDVAVAIGDRPCWHSRDGNCIFISDAHNQQLYATFVKAKSADEDKIDYRFVLSDGSTILEATEESCKRFTAFENKENLFLYGNNGLASRVEYPRLKMAATGSTLCYDINCDESVEKVSSILFKGWELAPFGERPGLKRGDKRSALMPQALPAGFTNYHLLKKGFQQKLLITGRQLKKEEGLPRGAFRTTCNLPDQLKKSLVYEYHLNHETNRLEISSAEGYLNLAYVNFVHQDYEAARFYLDKSLTVPGDLTHFNEIFEWIEAVEDESFEGISLKLHLLCRAEAMRKEAIIAKKQKSSANEKIEVKESPYTNSLNDLYIKYNRFLTGQYAHLHQQSFKLSSSDEQLLEQMKIKKVDIQNKTVIRDQVIKLKQKIEKNGFIATSVYEGIGKIKQHMVGSQLSNQLKTYFTVKNEQCIETDETLFTPEENDPSYVNRVMKQHLDDLKEARKTPSQTVELTANQASNVKTQLIVARDQLLEQKEALLRSCLNTIDTVKVAGSAAVERQIGEQQTTKIERLIALWRTGALSQQEEDGSLNNSLEGLAHRKLGLEERQELDWTITEYMSAQAELNHIERALTIAEEYLSSCDGHLMGDDQIALSLYTQVTTERAFVLYTQRSKLTLGDIASALCHENGSLKKELFEIQLYGHLLRVRREDKAYKTMSGNDFQDNINKELKEIKEAIQKSIEGKSDRRVLDVLKDIPEWELFEKTLVNDKKMRRLFCQTISDSDYRDLLSIEYSVGLTLRENQVKTFRSMVANPNSVHQLGMGGGKSKVILPLLAKRKANGTNLVALLLPETLYETNRSDLQTTNRELFQQEMFCFEYKRFADFNSIELEEVYLKLLKTIDKKGFIATTKSALLSFRNGYITACQELNNKGADEREEALAKLKVMADILKLFAERMDVIADEVDQVLNVRTETNFALGVPQPVDRAKTDSALEFMKIIFEADADSQLGRLQKALKNNSQKDEISVAERINLLRQITEIYYDKHKTDYNLTCDKIEFVSYMMNSNSPEQKPNDINLLKETNYDNYCRLAAFRAFLSNEGFRSTLSKSCFADYGSVLNDPTNPRTIPYKASNDPSYGSEYDSKIEECAYSMQRACFVNLEMPFIMKVISKLQDEAHRSYTEAKKNNKLFRYHDTEAFKQFKKMVEEINSSGEMAGISSDLSTYDSHNSIKRLTELVNINPYARMVFSKNYVLERYIKVFPNQANSNSEDLVDMVLHFGGFTGTPWNLHTFHDKIQSERNLGVDGRTYDLLLRHDTPIRTMRYDPSDPVNSLINAIPFTGESAFRAIVDTGAYLRGRDNDEFINAVLNLNTLADGVKGVYFDKEGKIVTKSKDKEPASIIDAPVEDKSKQVILYDQAHVVGADIKQDRRAKAAVTIGPDTTIRALFQSVWRQRELDKEQRVEFFVSQEVRALIMGENRNEPTINDVLRFCLKNEAQREAEDNYRAESKKIVGTAGRLMFNHLIDVLEQLGSELTIEEKITKISRLAERYEPHIIKAKAENEYDQYASVTTMVDPQETLNEMKNKAANILNAVASQGNWEVEHKNYRLELMNAARDLEERKRKPDDWMPNEVPKSQVEVAVEVEAQVQQEVDAQVQLQQLVEEEVEEVVEVPIQPTNETGGNTQMTGASIFHGDLLEIWDDLNPELSKVYNGKIHALKHHVGIFSENIFIGGMYEGRLKAYPNDLISEDVFMTMADKSNIHFDTEKARRRAFCILHAERLPINEALFMKGKTGWKAIFASTHDAYPSFSTFPTKNGTIPSALIALSSKAPIAINQNNGFEHLNENDKKEVMNLYVQLKFYKAEFHFDTKEEEAAIKAWLLGDSGDVEIQKKRVKDMRNYFEKVIRPTKSRDDQKGYSKSSLRYIFDGLEEQLGIDPS